MMIDRREDDMVRQSWYEASVTRGPDDPPLLGACTADVCIVGAGFAGLSAAIELRRRGFSVIVLEAERPGWGASGRNGGQVLPGYAGDDAVLRQLGPDRGRTAWMLTVEAVKLLQSRIAEYGIDCDFVPGYLHAATSERKRRELYDHVAAIRRDFGYDAIETLEPAEMRGWIDSPRYVGAAHDRLAGHIHPLKYCLGLADAARAAGAVIHANSKVLLIERGQRPVVRTEQGSVACRFVLAAGNAYLGNMLPPVAAKLLPVRSFIIATETLPADLAASLIRDRAAVSDTNFVLDYYRLSHDDRMLFGGRVASMTASPQELAPVLRERLALVFPQLAWAKVEHAWGGLIDLTLNRAPDFGRVDPNLYYLQGFAGHGVALAGLAGLLVAEAIAGQAERFDLFGGIQHRDVPGGPALHGPLLRLGILYHRLRELF
jgi:glycine/D-amino acid oxidase-like deaminating enzyme